MKIERDCEKKRRGNLSQTVADRCLADSTRTVTFFNGPFCCFFIHLFIFIIFMFSFVLFKQS